MPWSGVVPGLGRADAADRPKPPNIVLVLADDLGERDLACYGGDLVETPYLDQLAREGVRFRQAYAPAPICSPTRAALLTGLAPARLRMTIWLEGSYRTKEPYRLNEAESLHALPHDRVTLAEQLQRSGYLTALIGKWHLGDADHAPETQGFDINVGGNHWGAPATFFWPYRGAGRFGSSQMRYVPGLGFGQRGEYLTDRLTQEALRVIDHAGDRPFFLYLAHYAPHTPIEAKGEDVSHFAGKMQPQTRHRNPAYAAMIKSVDESVGSVRKKLVEKGLDRNTLFVFTSDNGGYIGQSRFPAPITDNTPHRSGKGSLYEGGLRVPLIVHWPGVSRAGATPDTPVLLTDLFPTLMAAAVVATDKSTPSDGLDLSGVLRDPAQPLARESLFFHYPHYYTTTDPVSAVRHRNWKLIQHLERGDLELYDLEKDPSERANLAEVQPAVAADLRGRLENWRNNVHAAMPSPNREFHPEPDLPPASR